MNKDIETLKEQLIEFRDRRDWKQFHTPVNLAVALHLEASEVLECFQWKADHRVFAEWIKDPKNHQSVKEELADVLSYLILLADSLDIDLYETTCEKIKLNGEKYPVEKAKGSAKKYTQL